MLVSVFEMLARTPTVKPDKKKQKYVYISIETKKKKKKNTPSQLKNKFKL